mmetsp:Transcript_57733/g.102449  ORF Transcript_57733/g.102449 Transcript_57733/m.102449 type:complete len:700 (-) Transcript_57733:34-2133(-)
MAKKAGEENSTLAVRAKAQEKLLAAKAAAKKAADRGLAPEMDDAIAQFLDGEDAPEKEGIDAAEDEPSGSEDEAEDDRLEKEISDHIEKRRKEERKEGKRLMERQKKQEWRKKMSLMTRQDSADQPELFKVTDKSVKALEDASAFPKELESEEEKSEDEAAAIPESDSDDELDRIARMEVDIAVSEELRKAHLEDKQRNVSQRLLKKKKETRRQQVMQAWAGELGSFSQSLQDQAATDKALLDQDDAAEMDDEDDIDEEDLAALRKHQESIESGKAGEGRDVEALRALADGPEDEELETAEFAALVEGGSQKRKKQRKAQDDEDEEETGPRAALTGPASQETALVPLDEEGLRGEHRASRWFSQDIFKGLSTSSSSRSRAIQAVDRDDDDFKDGDSDDGQMRELDDAQLPKLPLTDKEKRKQKRKKDTERLQKLGIKPKGEDEEEKGPLEVAPLEPPKSIVPSRSEKFSKPSDPKELAETLALGSLLVESKKSRMELMDAAYNRWTFDPNPALPNWFSEEEQKFNKPELPISKELMDQFRAKLREINARPIRKVTEARARKKRRLGKKLEKLRSTAMALSETSDMSETAKARQMRKAMGKLARQDQRKVTTVAIKKGGGGNKTDKGKVPKGAKTKVVDKRMKSDRRGEKKAAKRNPAKAKIAARKQQRKIARGKRRGMGDKGDKGGGKKRGRAGGGGGD